MSGETQHPPASDDGIIYLRGDATDPQTQGAKLIVHICNDIGGWGKGFVLAISKRWPEPEYAYRQWYRERADNDFALGAVQFVSATREITVANMVAQRDIHPSSEGPPVRYQAVADGLAKIADWAVAHDASVHMPRIGCGLAGGKWSEIGPLITKHLISRGVSVFVYDFAPS